jgi:hypothetical protein
MRREERAVLQTSSQLSALFYVLTPRENDMRAIQEAAPSNLSWQQPRALKAEYELRAGDELLATLRKSGAFGMPMEAEIGAFRFTLKTEGFVRSRITVREAGATGEPAIFGRAGFLGKGQLALPDGRSYRWKMASFWGGRWAFVDDSDRPLVSFTSRNRFLRAGCDVEIAPGALARPELPILVVLGWYLLLRMQEDSAATAA